MKQITVLQFAREQKLAAKRAAAKEDTKTKRELKEWNKLTICEIVKKAKSAEYMEKAAAKSCSIKDHNAAIEFLEMIKGDQAEFEKIMEEHQNEREALIWENAGKVAKRSGSWAAIYGALNGTPAGLGRAYQDITRNIKFYILDMGNKRQTTQLKGGYFIDWRPLRVEAEDIASETLKQVFLNGYFSEHNIYKIRREANKETLRMENGESKGIYKFSTILKKFLIKVVIKQHVFKYLSSTGNKLYRNKVDYLDIKGKQIRLDDLMSWEKIPESVITHPTGMVEADYLLGENKEGFAKFNYEALADSLADGGWENLTPTGRMVLRAMGEGAKQDNIKEFGIAERAYWRGRRELILKGVINNKCNIFAKSIKSYIEAFK